MSAHVSTPQTFVGTFRAMSETPEAYDAIIIGAGVIGAAIAHELAGRGWKTLTVDKAASAGAGSTINTCAIVRFS